MAASFSPTDLARVADPYPLLAELRATGPVVRLASGFWAVTGYDAALEVLRAPRLRLGTDRGALPRRPAARRGARRDEPSHQLPRSARSHPRARAWSRRRSRRGGWRACCRGSRRPRSELLDELAGEREFDLLHALRASAAVARDLRAARRAERRSRPADGVERRGGAAARPRAQRRRSRRARSRPRRSSTPISARCSTSGAARRATICSRRCSPPRRTASV